MRDIKIERRKGQPKLALRRITKGRASVLAQSIIHRPGEEIAQRDKVEVPIQCDGVVEAEILIIQDPVMNQADAARDETTVMAPEEKARAVWHLFAKARKELRRQSLELQGGARQPETLPRPR